MDDKTTATGEIKREKVRVIPIEFIDDFPDHPFLVKDDESMQQLIRSIEMNGVLNPVIARKKEGERYELISGHRRKRACIALGIESIPIIVRELTRDEAVIEMVDSNLQREYILPSEKAKAYKMKYEALKRRAGRPSKENLSPLATNLRGQRTDELVGAENGDSKDQVRRFIRLTELTPELLEFVDEGKIGMRPAVELSYLQEDEMRDLVDFIDNEGVFPSHAQTIRMRELSKNGKLDTDTINEIMQEEKPNQKEKFKMPMERLERFFPRGTPQKQVEETIIKALDYYRKHLNKKREDKGDR